MKEAYEAVTTAEALDLIAKGEKIFTLAEIDPELMTLAEFTSMRPVKARADEPPAEEPVEAEAPVPVEAEAPEPVEAGEQLEPVNPEEAVEPVKVKEPEKKAKASTKPKIDEGKVFALRAAGWNVTEIAQELGISKSGVYAVLARQKGGGKA